MKGIVKVLIKERGRIINKIRVLLLLIWHDFGKTDFVRP
jgi:hypothetical protein